MPLSSLALAQMGISALTARVSTPTFLSHRHLRSPSPGPLGLFCLSAPGSLCVDGGGQKKWALPRNPTGWLIDGAFRYTLQFEEQRLDEDSGSLCGSSPAIVST